MPGSWWLVAVIRVSPRFKFGAAASSLTLTRLGIRMLGLSLGYLRRTRVFIFDEPVSEVLSVGARVLST